VHWLPWRLRWRGAAPRGEDPGWIDLPLELGDFGFVVVALLGLVVFVFFILPALILVVEVLLLLVLMALTVAARLLFGRPWTVEAAGEGGEPAVKRWGVIGLRRSRRVVAHVADALERGATIIEPADAIGLTPPH
jgi:hypothetical protein